MLMMCLRRMRRPLPAAGLLALLALPSWGAREHTETVPVGERLPDAVLEGLNRPPRRLIEFRGRPLLINVWASWCGPCGAEMASLERLAWNDERGDFAIIGISTDDDAEQARAWLG